MRNINAWVSVYFFYNNHQRSYFFFFKEGSLFLAHNITTLYSIFVDFSGFSHIILKKVLPKISYNNTFIVCCALFIYCLKGIIYTHFNKLAFSDLKNCSYYILNSLLTSFSTLIFNSTQECILR